MVAGLHIDMDDLSSFGKILVGIGVLLLVVGLILVFAGKVPGVGALGRLPGDIYIKRDNFTFYFPITTGILISIVLSLILGLLLRR
jgi:formate hydrogenlyase subunit 3/multisubunit Na+/H+ antiporter MnhD subunit